MKFYSVVVMNGPDDDGSCSTFGNLGDAIRLARWARGQGLWFVGYMWS